MRKVMVSSSWLEATLANKPASELCVTHTSHSKINIAATLEALGRRLPERKHTSVMTHAPHQGSQIIRGGARAVESGWDWVASLIPHTKKAITKFETPAPPGTARLVVEFSSMTCGSCCWLYSYLLTACLFHSFHLSIAYFLTSVRRPCF